MASTSNKLHTGGARVGFWACLLKACSCDNPAEELVPWVLVAAEGERRQAAAIRKRTDAVRCPDAVAPVVAPRFHIARKRMTGAATPRRLYCRHLDGLEGIEYASEDVQETIMTEETLLARARAKLYAIAGGRIDSDDVRAARLTTAQRIEYFRSAEFQEWLAAAKAAGKEIFWLKDVDMTQAAGDIFTFFFKWRADNGKFSQQQLRVIAAFLSRRQSAPVRVLAWLTRLIWLVVGLLGIPLPAFASRTPYDVLRLWRAHEEGGEGISLLEFWSGAYWPSLVGLTRDQKMSQVRAFIPSYRDKIYPGVCEENRLLEALGVHVVIVSNGDQELAIAAAEALCIKPENVVGSPSLYDGDDLATGENHSYEVFAEEWAKRPQPGKHLNFHYWVRMNKHRWGWHYIDEDRIVLAGRDGDSASADGGMMIFLQSAAIGNFMVDTPDRPQRIKKFYSVAAKYGWTLGKFFTLLHSPSRSGSMPE